MLSPEQPKVLAGWPALSITKRVTPAWMTLKSRSPTQVCRALIETLTSVTVPAKGTLMLTGLLMPGPAPVICTLVLTQAV
ncbi:MAG: hypothetical protein HC927_13875 [Deltaproteobacteria bacterium]|nr:hypothetical protein [Deltaproteobacteria bacterium]